MTKKNWNPNYAPCSPMRVHRSRRVKFLWRKNDTKTHCNLLQVFLAARTIIWRRLSFILPLFMRVWSDTNLRASIISKCDRLCATEKQSRGCVALTVISCCINFAICLCKSGFVWRTVRCQSCTVCVTAAKHSRARFQRRTVDGAKRHPRMRRCA